MPGYYDWKVRNCGKGAIHNAQSLLETMEAVDEKLHKIWKDNGNSFPEGVNKRLAAVVGKIDLAEESLVDAKLALAQLFEGAPEYGDS